MAEVRGLPYNGLRAISTFSGCGGSCLGLRMAGFRVLWASEFVEEARRTYEANFPETPVDPRDIRKVEPADVLERAGLAEGEIDVLEGSPPCSPFSSSGSREEKWGRVAAYSETEQRTDDLFFEFARILRGLRPRAFLAENVRGLASGVSRGYLKEILAALEGAGYVVEARLLDASRLDVPQARVRLFMQGTRRDLGLKPAFPGPLPYVRTLGEALALARGAPIEEESRIGGTAISREAVRLRPGARCERYFNLRRPRTDRPCPTITQTGGVRGAASVVHPTELRKLSIAELRAVSGFPADFVLTGSYRQQYERIGRSVPPPMMRAVAAALAARLKEES